MSPDVTPDDALTAVLAGRTVRIVVGPDREDPTCLLYLDKCFEDDYEPMIYSEAVGGWSEGVKEAVCKPGNDFFVGFVADPPPLSIGITDEIPAGREWLPQ